jgi:1-deoxy-D-xylulose-5-phosphate synthase
MPPCATNRAPCVLKEASLDELKGLAKELRREIIRVTTANGGHLAANLGCVELTIALHHALDSPRDKIIWDVGHQSYAHKMLTGRRDRFATIRTTGGLSGFVNRAESPHDHMTSGHAGTALSAALGLARARDYLDDDYKVVAVVGDGALTAGLSYEALNDLGTFHSQLLLVLNDNSYTISPSQGGLADTLRRAQGRILDGNIFEQLGLEYLGPVDGHDLRLLLEVLRDAVRSTRPVVLHVVTQKGKGYPPAEVDPRRYHGVNPLDMQTYGLLVPQRVSYSQIFGREMLKIGEENDRVMAITAAMTDGTGLAEFAARYPDRFFDVSIAEQHAVTMAAGLASGGCRPVVAIYSTFLQRGYDQVIHDVCLQNLPVTFVIDRAGIVGADGPTHHGVFDLAYLRSLPRMVVLAPKDQHEFARMLRAAIAHDGPAAIRIPRRDVSADPERSDGPTSLHVGQGELLREGQDVGLVAIGNMVARAMEAARALESHGIEASVVNARFVKPLDAPLLLETARKVKHLFTLEEHVGHGGFGSAVLELLAAHRVATPVCVLALPDRFIEHGSTDVLLDACGLSTEKIVSRVLAELQETSDNATEPVLAVDMSRVRERISSIRDQELPAELQYWAGEYEKVGYAHRDRFLWKWCLEAIRLTSLPCVDATLHDANCVTKVLGVMLDVLLDDIADRSGPVRYLEKLLAIPYAESLPDFAEYSEQERAYAAMTCRVWDAIMTRAGTYPRHEEFAELLRFDYLQVLNAMRYSHLLNRNPELVNMVEHNLYLPHNMHMMVSGTLDLMCSSEFDPREIGRVREAVWNAQCMGRIGNWVTTWERELRDRDFTSGVFAYAAHIGLLQACDLRNADTEVIRERIASHGCERFFLERWHHHRRQLVLLAASIKSVDILQLVSGLEQLVEIHLGSRGLK